MTLTVVFQPYLFQENTTGAILNSGIDRFETLAECEADGQEYTERAREIGATFHYRCVKVNFEIDTPGRDS